MTEPSREDVEALIDKLENSYAFECEGGPLKNCVDWHMVRDAATRLSEVEKERDIWKNAAEASGEIIEEIEAERDRMKEARPAIIEECLKALPPSHTACGQDALLMWRSCYVAIRALAEKP